MKVVNLTQGSAEWHAHRAKHFNASDAPAMFGTSKFETRSELIHRLATGETKEIPPELQRVFDDGHTTEAMARPIVEDLIGEELFPVVGVSDEYPRLSASFDGVTDPRETGFEHKRWNEELAEKVRTGAIADDPAYWPQLEQQILVGGLQRVIFTVSDGTAERMETYTYTPRQGRAEQLLAGWAQFEKDLAAYTPEAPKAAAVGRAPESLPALRVEVKGMVTASNLAEFREHAMTVFRSINRDLKEDQDFADAEKTVKWCGDVEARLKAAKDAVLAQTADIEAVFRTIDDLVAAARDARLDLNNLVKARKDAIRTEIGQAAAKDLAAHVFAVNQRLGKYSLPGLPADIAGAMKGKKTVASLREAANNEALRVKLEADRWATLIEKNAAQLDAKADGYQFLFADANDLVRKDPDAVDAIIAKRIADHTAEQARKAAEAAERARREEEQRLAQQQAAQQTAAAPATPQAAQAATAAPQVTTAPPAKTGGMREYAELRKRPTASEFINLIATTYQVSAAQALEWLTEEFSTTTALEG